MPRKSTLLFLSLPLVAGGLYLRSLSSWRPHKVFAGQEVISDLTFSGDGKTLLVSHRQVPIQLTALDVTHDFAQKWTFSDYQDLGHPQFFLSDNRILVDQSSIRILDANTGNQMYREGELRKATISQDGLSLVYNGSFPSDMGCERPGTVSQSDVFIRSLPPGGPKHKNDQNRLPLDQGTFPASFSFAPDGQTFVVNTVVINERGGRSRLDLYNPHTKKRTRFWWSDNGYSPDLLAMPAQWSRNGRFLLTSSMYIHRHTDSRDVILSLWRASDGKKLAAMTVKAHIQSAMFASKTIIPKFQIQDDGRLLRFGADGPITLSKSSNWNVGFKTLLALPSENLTSAALSPDGSYLVAGTASGKILRQRIK